MLDAMTTKVKRLVIVRDKDAATQVEVVSDAIEPLAEI